MAIRVQVMTSNGLHGVFLKGLLTIFIPKIKIIHYHFTQRRVLRLILLLDGDMMPMVRILQEHLQQIGKSMKSNYIKQQVHIV